MKKSASLFLSVLLALMIGSFDPLSYWRPQAHATVNEVAARNDYTGNGSTTAFTYTFRITDKTHIEVLVDGTVKTVDSDYTVSGVDAATGGAVTFTTAPASGAKIALLRKQPLAQQSDYIKGEGFPSERVEKDLDKLTMGQQMQAEQINRSLHVPKKSTLTGNQTEIDIQACGDKFLKANAAGTGLECQSFTSTGSVGLPVSPNDGGTGSANTTGYTKAGLGAAGTAGRSRRVTDSGRGIYCDNGTNWWQCSPGGGVIDAGDFGATGVEPTNDTAALRAAIAAGQNGDQPIKVVIPCGSYVITDTLLPTPTTLRTVHVSGMGICTRIINRIVGEVQAGTVTVTNGSATVEGSGTSWTNDLVGATVRFGSDTEFYVVTGVTDTDTLTLLQGGFSGTYRGNTASGVTMRWHKPVFAINDPVSSQANVTGSLIENMWIDNGRDGVHLVNNVSNAIEITNGVGTQLRNLVLTPFGHGISHRKITIITHGDNIRIWPDSYVKSVTSANLGDKDALQFESGSEDATIYRNLYVTSGRSAINSGVTGVGSTNLQVIFDGPLVQGLYAPVADELGTATAIGASSLTDGGKTWQVNKYRGALVTITSGTGQGQTRLIASNTATVLTLLTPWDTADTPVATSGYQIGGGAMIFGGGALGVTIRDAYFENTPGVGSGGNAWGDIAIYFGAGSANSFVTSTGNGTGAFIYANDPATNDTWGNLVMGGQIDRLRIDTGVIRNTFIHFRIGVEGGADSGVQNHGTLTAFINSARPSIGQLANNQQWGQPIVANASDYRILDNVGIERPVLAFKGTIANVTQVRGGTTGTVANDASVTIGNKSDFLGTITVNNGASEKTAIFQVSTGAVVEVADPDAAYSTTSGTATSTNLFISAGNLIIENKTGANANYRISMLGP